MGIILMTANLLKVTIDYAKIRLMPVQCILFEYFMLA